MPKSQPSSGPPPPPKFSPHSATPLPEQVQNVPSTHTPPYNVSLHLKLQMRYVRCTLFSVPRDRISALPGAMSACDFIGFGDGMRMGRRGGNGVRLWRFWKGLMDRWFRRRGGEGGGGGGGRG